MKALSITRKGRDLPVWISLLWSELTANRTFTWSFILNLSLGLIGLSMLDTFKTAVEMQIASRSQSALGADIVVSASRPITPEEITDIRQALPAGSSVRWEDSLLSMISTVDGTASRLVEVRAVDEDYPFYGDILVKNGGRIDQTTKKDIITSPHVWMSSELATQLGVVQGNSVKIGSKTFVLSDLVEHDPSASAQGFALAPRIFIGRSYLPETGLIGPGTRRWQSALIKIPPGPGQANDLSLLTKRLSSAVKSLDLSIKNHQGAASDMNRAALYLNDYLGLVALVALFLAGVGSVYLFQGLLARRAPDMAILQSLGMPTLAIISVYLAQVVVLAVVAVFLTAVVTLVGLPFLPKLFSGLLPPGLIIKPQLSSLLLISGMAVIANLLVCAPLLLRLRNIRPVLLFQEGGQGTHLSGIRGRHLLTWLPAILFYAALAIWQCHSVKIGLIFVGGLLGSGLLLAGVALLLTSVLFRVASRLPLPFELASTRLARHKVGSLTSMGAIGLGTLLLTLIPLLEQLLQEGFKTPPTGELPSLFLIDIQEDQAEPLQETLTANGAKLSPFAPLIRARLSEINGKAIAKSKDSDKNFRLREDEESERTLNRGFNLSYRQGPSDSAQIIRGQPFSGDFDPSSGKAAEISLEIRFAERMGVSVGDKMVFDVQGVPVEGQVVNLRRVQWTSFQPNFFIEFQPGVLDDAPKSLIAAISSLPVASKLAIQKDLALSFPNVTVIDVTQVMERLLATAGQMSLALKMMAFLTLAAGIGVLLAIARTESAKRRPDVVLLKALGMGFGRLRLATAWEFALLGFISASIGAGLSVLGAMVFTRELFDSMGVLDYRMPATICAAVTLLCMVTGLIATESALKAKAQQALSSKQWN